MAKALQDLRKIIAPKVIVGTIFKIDGQSIFLSTPAGVKKVSALGGNFRVNQRVRVKQGDVSILPRGNGKVFIR